MLLLYVEPDPHRGQREVETLARICAIISVLVQYPNIVYHDLIHYAMNEAFRCNHRSATLIVCNCFYVLWAAISVAFCPSVCLSVRPSVRPSRASDFLEIETSSLVETYCWTRVTIAANLKSKC